MTVIRSTPAAFEADARLVEVLGAHLISDPVVGILELVKNGHDADARQVIIQALHLREPTARLIVQDDGFGMNAHDVTTRFLRAATGRKFQQKQQAERTPGGRMPLGEKGIGRFATHALARSLELVTRRSGYPEVVLRIDWDCFEQGGALNEIPLEMWEREPEVFQDGSTGSRLTMTRLRQDWGHAALDRLQRGLRRLKSPFPRFGLTAFDVVLNCPDHPKFEDLDSVDLLRHSHYRFRVHVGPTGSMDCEYTCQHPADSLARYTWKDSLRDELTLGTLACGPFSMTLFAFDRDSRYLGSATSGVRHGAEFNGRDLDAICGVSVFKDDVRVLPYGEAGNDWLQLDQSRINDPSGRLGNKQVVGFIELSHEHNPGLREKSDREGFQESVALTHFRAAVQAALEVFRRRWVEDRPKHGHNESRLREMSADARIEHFDPKGRDFMSPSEKDGVEEETRPRATVQRPSVPLNKSTDTWTTASPPPVVKRELQLELGRAIGAELRLIDDLTPKDRALAAYEAYGKLLHALATDTGVPCHVRTVIDLLMCVDRDLSVEGESFRAQVAPSRLLAAVYGCDRVILVPSARAIELSQPQPTRLDALLTLFPQLEQTPSGVRIRLPQVPGGAD